MVTIGIPRLWLGMTCHSEGRDYKRSNILAKRLPQRFLHLRQPIWPLEDLARLGAVGGAYDAVSFHQVNQVCGAAVADAQAALQEGSRGLAEIEHQAHGVFEQLIVLGFAFGAIAGATGFGAVAIIFDRL